MYLTTDGVLHISLEDVVLIEVEDVVPGDATAGDYTGRTIRFSSHTGEIVEISCDAVGVDALELQGVEKLSPVDRRKVRKRKWLRPRLYKGT